ncbi:MAG: hypothetical protein DWP97_12270 [Calditrichaeota bacterium]|nr:MAG: hypothetical protein DWP97_12270 [Calditrichota bacterium]
MKKTIFLLLMLLTAAVQADESKPWVDMINCPICNNVTAEEGLAENMTWEHQLTATGMVSSFTVKPEFMPHFKRAKAGMKEKIDLVMAGDKLDICGYCTSVTDLLKVGVKADNVITKGSDVMVLSSIDAEMIKKIHAHGQATIDFLK